MFRLLRSFRMELSRVIYTGDPAPVILGSSAVVLYIGVTLLRPFSTFSSSPSWGYIRDLPVPEWVWGVAFACISVGKLVTLAYNALPRLRPKRWSYWVASALNFFMAVLWFNLALGIQMSNPEGVGHALFYAGFVASLWACARRFHVAVGND